MRRSCQDLVSSLKSSMQVFFSNACKRRVCGDPSDALVERTWISRSSAFLLSIRMLVREGVAEAQVKSGSQRQGSLEAAPLFFFFFFLNACTRSIFGDPSEVLVERTWISRSSVCIFSSVL